MILEGKVIKCIGTKEGTSQSGKSWKLAQYLIDTTTNEQYPKQVAVEVFGEDRINELSLIPDEQVKLNVEVESREWNGKWFTSVRAWGRAEEDAAQPAAQSTERPVEMIASASQPVPTQPEETLDLPF